MLPIQLDTLLVMDAIARQGSFAAAAVELNRVPSALSYSVQKAEESLGVTLFNREGRRAVMTSAGQHLLEQGRFLLKAVEDIADSTRKVASGWEPKFTLAIETILDTSELYPMVKAFCTLNPDAAIHIHEEVLSGTVDALLDKRVDLAIGISNEISLPEGIVSMLYRRIEVVLVAHPNHPITQLKRPVKRDELQSYRVVVARDSTRKLPATTIWVQHQQPKITVNSMQQKIDAQIAGLGIGRLPLHRITDELAEGRLVIIEESEPQPPIELAVAWRKGDKNKTLAWFKNALRKTL